MKAGEIFKVLRGREITFLLNRKTDKIEIYAPDGVITKNIKAFLKGRRDMIKRILEYQTDTDIEQLKSKYNALLKKNQEYAWICDTVGFPECENLVEHELEKMTAIELTQLAQRIKDLQGSPMDNTEWLKGFRDYHTDEELILALKKYFGELEEITPEQARRSHLHHNKSDLIDP